MAHTTHTGNERVYGKIENEHREKKSYIVAKMAKAPPPASNNSSACKYEIFLVR